MQKTRPPHSFTYVLCVNTGVQVLTAIVTSESQRAPVGQYVRHSSHIDEHEGIMCSVTSMRYNSFQMHEKIFDESVGNSLDVTLYLQELLTLFPDESNHIYRKKQNPAPNVTLKWIITTLNSRSTSENNFQCWGDKSELRE